jgi:hypothetical protein
VERPLDAADGVFGELLEPASVLQHRPRLRFADRRIYRRRHAIAQRDHRRLAHPFAGAPAPRRAAAPAPYAAASRNSSPSNPSALAPTSARRSMSVVVQGSYRWKKDVSGGQVRLPSW